MTEHRRGCVLRDSSRRWWRRAGRSVLLTGAAAVAACTAQVRPLGPDHALVLGQFRLTGGGRPDPSGRFSLTWARTPDGWRMLHDHAS